MLRQIFSGWKSPKIGKSISHSDVSEREDFTLESKNGGVIIGAEIVDGKVFGGTRHTTEEWANIVRNLDGYIKEDADGSFTVTLSPWCDEPVRSIPSRDLAERFCKAAETAWLTYFDVMAQES